MIYINLATVTSLLNSTLAAILIVIVCAEPMESIARKLKECDREK
jgi:hypothetical protein